MQSDEFIDLKKRELERNHSLTILFEITWHARKKSRYIRMPEKTRICRHAVKYEF